MTAEGETTAGGGGAAAESSSAQQPAPKPKEPKPKEYNQRWKGYTILLITSLVSFSSISGVPLSNIEHDVDFGVSITFGAFTFTVSFLILFVDRCCNTAKVNVYTKAYDGKLEGYTLIFLVIWWVVGVGYITRTDGIGYLAMNIYLSSWFSLAACVYTLNEWSSSKDIISFDELTRLSSTLKSWYSLLFSSLVVFGSSADLLTRTGSVFEDDASFAMSTGLFSSLVSLLFILEHVNIRCCKYCKHGGWLELGVAAFLIVVWVIAVSVLTKHGGIAATVTADTNGFGLFIKKPGDNCSVTVLVQNDDKEAKIYDLSCDFVPGSNLYIFTWWALISSIMIAFRWKAAQAIQFAHAQDRTMMERAGLEDEDDIEDDEDAI